MAISFPTSLDTLINPTSTSNQSVLSHSDQHANANDAIEALEAKVGINGSADTSSLDYKTSRLTTKGDILTHDGTNPIRKAVGTNGYMLVADNTQATGLNWISPTAGGTVTSTSVASANGFSGTVANPTTTPSITLSTTITGLIKGNGTAISAATAGTDYSTPATATPVGTIMDYAGSSAPTYWLLCDGTAVSRTTYSALFAVIGTTYGAGNGTTTFNLPDTRGRVSVSKDSGTFSALGATGGAETHTLTISEMPAHGHDLLTGDAGGGVQSKIQKQTGVYNPTWETQIGAYDIVGSKGGGSAHNNLQPYIVFNKIIKY